MKINLLQESIPNLAHKFLIGSRPSVVTFTWIQNPRWIPWPLIG